MGEWQSAFQTMGTITQKLHAVSARREDIQDSDATMVLASTDVNAATEGSNVLMLAMRWTASGVSALEFLCLRVPGRLRRGQGLSACRGDRRNYNTQAGCRWGD